MSAFDMFIFAGFIRALVLLYGIFHDMRHRVKFTDIDYFVFTDAAGFANKGESPYNRDTYRYTPIISWMLLPNITISPHWGKIMFCVFDLLVGYLIYRTVLNQKHSLPTAAFCCQLWLFNPLTLTVSCRGNAESLLSALILLALLYIMSKDRTLSLLGYATFGFSIHMKIYPITYLLPIYLYLSIDSFKRKRHSLFELAVKLLWPCRRRLIFVTVSVFVCAGVTLFCYKLYGYEFLFETYLYHVVRKDTRHNFSPYFYMLYLTSESSSTYLGIAAFLPQAVLLVCSSVVFYRDLPFCCFLNTFIFVTFNKVCTSQYFIWYLSLLPLVVPSLHMSLRRALALLGLWFLAQGLWLLPAYYLEFEGQNSFFYIWLAGLFFFSVNIYIAAQLIQNYNPEKSAKLKPLQAYFFKAFKIN